MKCRAIHYLLGLTFLHIVCLSIAQDSSVIPGELELLRGPINDTDKARTYNWICFNYAYDNPEEGIRFGRLGLELSHKLGFKKGIGDAHSNMGFCFTCESKFDSARVHYEKAIEAFRKTGNDCWTKVPIANLGSNYFKRKDYVNALEKYLEVARIEDGCEDRGFKSTSIYAVGTVYNAMDKYDLAISYFEKALAIDVANGDTTKMADRYMAMGNAYTGLGNIKEARYKFSEAIKLCNAIGEVYRIGFAYMGLAKLEFKEGNYEEAIEQGELARKHFKSGERTSDWLGACTLLGELYIKNESWSNAQTVLKEGLIMAEELDVQTDRLSVYEKLALVSMKLGAQSDASLYFDKYLSLRDTVQAQELNDRLADYSTLYETEKKQKELVQEREKNLAADLELKEQQFQKRIFLIGGILSLLFALVLINRYRLKQRIAKELEEKNQLIEREKARAEEGERFKQQFLANMSHEMRTPVSVISGLTSLLKNRKSEDNTNKYIEAIHHSAESLVSMVNDVLDLSKMETGKMTLNHEDFSLRKELGLLTESFHPQAAKRDIYLNTEVAKELPDTLKGDSRRFKQVLYNLISNAIKFTDKGGVTIRCSLVQDKITTNVQLKVDVEDTGTGMSPDVLRNIFEDYVQAGHADRGGTGLGLGIARQLARLMGGDIQVESEINRGSTFTFTSVFEVSKDFDANRKVLGQVYIDALRQRIGSNYILVVDDYPYNRMLAVDTLKQWFPDVECEEVASGEDAIKAVLKKEPSFILMDVRMNPMSGTDCTRQLRTFTNVPVIALTASVLTTDRDECLASGMDEVVLKPFAPNDLLSAIGFVLKRPVGRSDYGSASPSKTAWPYLEELCEGNETKIDKYLKIALEEIPLLLNEMNSAIETNNSTSLKMAIHRSISYLYSTEMHLPAAQAQQWESEDGNEILRTKDRLNDWINDVKRGLDRVKDYLEKKI
jgi:signal transduction histidine kinase/CheY-like chemotaxis protein/tetratricopeptide (TPR) repeat protein/HPt (histidine-containing phosphotransfer) domain-containing protein